MIRQPPQAPLFPYTTLFRSKRRSRGRASTRGLFLCPEAHLRLRLATKQDDPISESPHKQRREEERCASQARSSGSTRSEEHTSELQSRLHLVCRLLLEKKKD